MTSEVVSNLNNAIINKTLICVIFKLVIQINKIRILAKFYVYTRTVDCYTNKENILIS